MLHESLSDQRWMWLRFIPLKLHLVFVALGAFVGSHFQDPFGTYAGLILGGVIGVPLQLKKLRCMEIGMHRRAALEEVAPARLHGVKDGLDLHPGRNLLQLIAGIISAGCGALVGYSLPEGERVLAAALGATLGFIAGVFLAGCALLTWHYAHMFHLMEKHGRDRRPSEPLPLAQPRSNSARCEDFGRLEPPSGGQETW